MRKDIVYLLFFYFCLLASIVYYYYYLKIEEMYNDAYYTHQIYLGIFWIVLAAVLNYVLWQIHQKSFSQMSLQEKRGIGISVFVMALGGFLVIRSTMKLLF